MRQKMQWESPEPSCVLRETASADLCDFKQPAGYKSRSSWSDIKTGREEENSRTFRLRPNTSDGKNWPGWHSNWFCSSNQQYESFGRDNICNIYYNKAELSFQYEMFEVWSLYITCSDIVGSYIFLVLLRDNCSPWP